MTSCIRSGRLNHECVTAARPAKAEEDEEAEHEHVGVKYYARVHVRDARGGDAWNTNEVRRACVW